MTHSITTEFLFNVGGSAWYDAEKPYGFLEARDAVGKYFAMFNFVTGKWDIDPNVECRDLRFRVKAKSQ